MGATTTAAPAADYVTARSAWAHVVLDWLESIGAIAFDEKAAELRERPGGNARAQDGRTIWVHPAIRTDRWTRAIHRWRFDRLSCVDFYGLDALCVQLGRHVSEVPAHAWRSHSAKSGKTDPPPPAAGIRGPLGWSS